MPDQIARIDALTKTARTTWFALLSVLIFVGITLMSVEHIDFYGVDRATQLPLINISVPTRLFFYAAPILVAAIYSYFHLYLIRLWDVLAVAKPRIDGQRLGDAISPWLICDVALYLRASRWGRKDNCIGPRSMEMPSALWNFLLAWALGPVVLAFLWWQSMPARDWLMTTFAAIGLIAVCAFGGASLTMLYARMRQKANTPPRVWGAAPVIIDALVGLALVISLTYAHTMGPASSLAKLTLTGEQLTRRPDGWQPPDIARADALANWCRRENPGNCKQLTNSEQTAFDNDWTSRRRSEMTELQKPPLNPLRSDEVESVIATALDLDDLWPVDFSDEANYLKFRLAVAEQARKAPDFRDADLRDAFMVNLNLTGTRMQGVRASGANLERVDLSFANLTQSADLSKAILASADLRWAQMQRADFNRAQMKGANLSNAQMQGAILSRAQMQGAILSRAQMQGADFSNAQMQWANLSQAQMQGADLRNAQMQGAILRSGQNLGFPFFNFIYYLILEQGADLSNAQMQGANLNNAQMEKVILHEAQMRETDLRGARLQGAQIQGADLSFSLLTGTQDKPTVLQDTNLSASINNGGALRFVDLTPAFFDNNTDWRNVFLDASVQLSDDFHTQMGFPSDQPCQWADFELSDEMFFGHWRGWLQAAPNGSNFLWRNIAPEPWRDVTPIPPPEGCTWQTGPMPGTDPPEATPPR